MSLSVMLQEWCDGNMHRNYPVLDDASCLSLSGTYLPSSFLVDMQIVLPYMGTAINDPKNRLYIHSIIRTGQYFQVAVGFRGDSSFVCALTEPIPADTTNLIDVNSRTFVLHPQTTTIPDKYAALRGLSGHFIVGSCVDMTSIGTLSFSYAATQLMPLRVYMLDQGLSSVSFVNSAGGVVTLYNDFTIRAGDGVDFGIAQELQPDDTTRTVVTINRIPLATDTQEAFTSVDDVINALMAKLGSPIRRINGLAPSSDGNFVIDGSECTKVDPNEHGIALSNACAKPCCSEVSAADVESAMRVLEQAQTRLAAYYEALTTNVNTMQARLSSLIASRH